MSKSILQRWEPLRHIYMWLLHSHYVTLMKLSGLIFYAISEIKSTEEVFVKKIWVLTLQMQTL